MQAQNRTGVYHDVIKRDVRLFLWTLAWVATLALARFGPSSIWDSQTAASWAAIAANVAVGIGWIAAHARYLHEVDELHRKIMQDALAVTLGVGWVVGFAYVVAEAADLISRDINLGIFPALLGVVYMIAIAAGHARFR